MENSKQNELDLLVKDITEALRMVNVGALRASEVDAKNEEALRELHTFVKSRQQFSIGEIDAIAAELGDLLKK
ncbi:MAG: DUF1128 family protein [Bacilli bacterium]